MCSVEERGLETHPVDFTLLQGLGRSLFDKSSIDNRNESKRAKESGHIDCLVGRF